jgi:putative peptidoglycan lipid II flippase
LAALINTGCLYVLLRKRGYYTPRAGWKAFSIRLLSANAVLAIWLIVSAGSLDVWLNQTVMWRIGHLLLSLGGSIPLYFAMLWLTGIKLHHLLMPQAAVSR